LASSSSTQEEEYKSDKSGYEDNGDDDRGGYCASRSARGAAAVGLGASIVVSDGLDWRAI
jgi:hypothetical protein